MTKRLDQTKALGNAARMQVLDWLKEPGEHFAHQITGDPQQIGVCVTLLAEKLNVSQPTASRHLDQLRRAGFLKTQRIGQWSFYSRDENGISDYGNWVKSTL